MKYRNKQLPTLFIALLLLLSSCGWKKDKLPEAVDNNTSENTVDNETAWICPIVDDIDTFDKVQETVDGNFIITGLIKKDYFEYDRIIWIIGKDGKLLDKKIFNTDYIKDINQYSTTIIKEEGSTYSIYYLEKGRKVSDSKDSEEIRNRESTSPLNDYVLKEVVINDNKIGNEKTMYCSDIFADFITNNRVTGCTTTSVGLKTINGKLFSVGEVKIDSLYEYIPYMASFDGEKMVGKVYPEFPDGEFDKIIPTDGNYNIEGGIHTKMDGQFWVSPIKCTLDPDLNIIQNADYELEPFDWDNSYKNIDIADTSTEDNYLVEDYEVSHQDSIIIKKKRNGETIWSYTIRKKDATIHITPHSATIVDNGDLIIPINCENMDTYYLRLSEGGMLIWEKELLAGEWLLSETTKGHIIVSGRDKNTEKRYLREIIVP